MASLTDAPTFDRGWSISWALQCAPHELWTLSITKSKGSLDHLKTAWLSISFAFSLVLSIYPNVWSISATNELILGDELLYRHFNHCIICQSQLKESFLIRLLLMYAASAHGHRSQKWKDELIYFYHPLMKKRSDGLTFLTENRCGCTSQFLVFDDYRHTWRAWSMHDRVCVWLWAVCAHAAASACAGSPAYLHNKQCDYPKLLEMFLFINEKQILFEELLDLQQCK